MTDSPDWPAVLDADDRRQFFRDLRASVAHAEAACDMTPVNTCLREWRVTAIALSDTQARAVLTSALSPADFTEVRRPGQPGVEVPQ